MFDFLKIPEVAKILGVTRNTIYLWIRAGKIPALMVGAKLRINREDVKAFVKAYKKKGAA